MNVLLLHRFEPFMNVMENALRATTAEIDLTVGAKSLDELNQAAHGKSFGLVISDLMLEDAQGEALVSQLEDSLPGMKLVFVFEPGKWDELLDHLEEKGHVVISRDTLAAQAVQIINSSLSLNNSTKFKGT